MSDLDTREQTKEGHYFLWAWEEKKMLGQASGHSNFRFQILARSGSALHIRSLISYSVSQSAPRDPQKGFITSESLVR